MIAILFSCWFCFSWCLCGVKIYSFIISANYGNSTDDFVRCVLFLLLWRLCMHFFLFFILAQSALCLHYLFFFSIRSLFFFLFQLHCNHLCLCSVPSLSFKRVRFASLVEFLVSNALANYIEIYGWLHILKSFIFSFEPSHSHWFALKPCKSFVSKRN